MQHVAQIISLDALVIVNTATLIACAAALFFRSGQTARIWSNIRKISDRQAAWESRTREMLRETERNSDTKIDNYIALVTAINTRLSRIEGKLEVRKPDGGPSDGGL